MRCLLESFVFSGGLKSWGRVGGVIHREGAESDAASFVRSVYESTNNEGHELHAWLDQCLPEPAWKRKRQPVLVGLELKVFAALVHLCGYEDLLYRYHDSLVDFHLAHHHSLDDEPPTPAELPAVPGSVQGAVAHRGGGA